MAVTVVEAITAENGTAAKFEVGFLAKCPIPEIEDPGNPGQMIPEFATAKLWLRAWIIRNAIRASRHGYDIIAQQSAVTVDDNDLT